VAGELLHADISEIIALEDVLRGAGNQAPHVIRRGLNRAGGKVRTKVIRALRDQTGAKYGAVKKALRTKKASYNRLEYRIEASGQHISLKEFGARQTKKGVSAAPWNQRRIFPHTFGPRIGKLGGHVFVRTTKDRRPLEKLWGPAIPKELVKGETEAAFYASVFVEVPAAILHELEAILIGAVPR